MLINMSFRGEEALRDQLDEIAQALDRNRNWVIVDALKKYVEKHREEIEQIQKGIAASDAGQFLTTEQLRGEMKVWNARAKEDRKREKAYLNVNKASARRKSA